MALKVEGVVDGGVHAEKPLGGASRLERLHFALSSSHRLMRVFGPIVLCALTRCTVLPGGRPGRQTLAPAGSTRGGSGGDEWSDAAPATQLADDAVEAAPGGFTACAHVPRGLPVLPRNLGRGYARQ
jgi:hypothetical protein